MAVCQKRAPALSVARTGGCRWLSDRCAPIYRWERSSCRAIHENAADTPCAAPNWLSRYDDVVNSAAAPGGRLSSGEARLITAKRRGAATLVKRAGLCGRALGHLEHGAMWAVGGSCDGTIIFSRAVRSDAVWSADAVIATQPRRLDALAAVTAPVTMSGSRGRGLTSGRRPFGREDRRRGRLGGRCGERPWQLMSCSTPAPDSIAGFQPGQRPGEFVKHVPVGLT
jgi:hypothetical protein